jgi:hypothetical protein
VCGPRPGRRAHGERRRAIGLELESGSAMGAGSGMTGGSRLSVVAGAGERSGGLAALLGRLG